MWSQEIDVSKGTKRNRRWRGYGTWGEEAYNLHQVEQQKLRRRRGKGTWGSETARMYREQRRRERQGKNLLARLLG
jgi:hypothetical protein